MLRRFSRAACASAARLASAVYREANTRPPGG